jgi:hypothetical protein
MPGDRMASNVLLLTILGAGCVCSMSCMSSLIFIRHQRDLAKDVLLANAEIADTEAQIAAINAIKPPPVPKADPILAKPQDMSEKQGSFEVPWWQGCLVTEKDRVTYKEGEPSKCDATLFRVPISPLQVQYPQRGVVNDAFVIKSGTRYVGRDLKLVSVEQAARLRRDANGALEVVHDDVRLPDNTKALKKRACWNIRSKSWREETDRVTHSQCARWEIP